MNYFGLVISTFPSTFSHHSPQTEICIQFQLLGTKAIPEVQLLSLQGFTLSHQTDPCLSPLCTGQPAWAALSNRGVGQLPVCLLLETLCTPEPTGSWWGVTMGSRADWSGQGRRGMEYGREWGLLRAKCSTHCAAGPGPQGRDGILHIFPCLAQDLHACMKAGDAQ